MRMKIVIGAMVAAACLSGCGNANKTKLQRGFDQANYLLKRVSRDPIAAAAWGSLAEGGGSVITYITASLSDEPDAWPHFTTEKPTQAWSVVIRDGEKAGDYVIEGYGEDLNKPLMTATVTVSPVKPRE